LEGRGFIWLGIGTSGGYFEYGSKESGFIKCGGGISLLTEKMLASEKGCFAMKIYV
jgi:hypothetical protein